MILLFLKELLNQFCKNINYYLIIEEFVVWKKIYNKFLNVIKIVDSSNLIVIL